MLCSLGHCTKVVIDGLLQSHHLKIGWESLCRLSVELVPLLPPLGRDRLCLLPWRQSSQFCHGKDDKCNVKEKCLVWLQAFPKFSFRSRWDVDIAVKYLETGFLLRGYLSKIYTYKLIMFIFSRSGWSDIPWSNFGISENACYEACFRLKVIL